MEVFKKLRLILWVIILAVCVGILISYQVVQRTILSDSQLKQWVTSVDGYTLIREKEITPQIVSKVQAFGDVPSNLVSGDTIRSAVDTTLSTQVLQQKINPVIDVISDWLNSKRPDITFSVDTTDIQKRFFTNLETVVVKKASTLPVCTYTNTVSDVDQGLCLPSYTTPQAVGQSIIGQIQAHQSDFLDNSITQNDVMIPTQSTIVKDIPDYINYLWTLAIMAAGVFIILAVTLLFTRRLVGVVAIGLGVGLGGLAVSVVGLVIRSKQISPQGNDLYRALSQTVLQTVEDQMVSLGAICLASGFALAIVAFLVWTWWRKRK